MVLVKAGYLNFYRRGFLSRKWIKYYFTLDEDSTISWYEDDNASKPEGSICIRNVSKFLSVGPFTRCIPKRPSLDASQDLLMHLLDEDLLIAIPKNLDKKPKEVLWISCYTIDNLNDWMEAIVGTLSTDIEPESNHVSVQPTSYDKLKPYHKPIPKNRPKNWRNWGYPAHYKHDPYWGHGTGWYYDHDDLKDYSSDDSGSDQNDENHIPGEKILENMHESESNSTSYVSDPTPKFESFSMPSSVPNSIPPTSPDTPTSCAPFFSSFSDQISSKLFPDPLSHSPESTPSCGGNILSSLADNLSSVADNITSMADNLPSVSGGDSPSYGDD